MPDWCDLIVYVNGHILFQDFITSNGYITKCHIDGL